MRKFVYLVLLFTELLANQANATPGEIRYYDVEIIIYENLQQDPQVTENWPTSIETKIPEKSLFINAPFPGKIPEFYNPRYTFKSISKAHYQLLEEAKLIEASDKYRLLYHRAWRQPGMERDEAVTVRLQTEAPALPQSSIKTLQQTVTSGFMAPVVTIPGFTETTAKLPTSNKLQGFIKIILSRYLHIYADVQYTTHAVVETSNEGMVYRSIKPQIYRLKQTRKMRSNELHYLDHPKLGLLVYIHPYNVRQSAH